MNIVSGKPRAAEYEPDPDLRDSEQVSYEILTSTASSGR